VSTALSRDDSVRLAHAADASGIVLLPDAIARPESADEVAEILRRASAERTPVTAAGAQTSYTCASTSDVGIVLSTRGMDRIADLDVAARTVRVGPGALVGAVKRACAAEGLLFPPDPTSEEECTIGGAVACNASGARSLRYGATRAHVRGVTVALASGERVTFRRPALEKNTVGYALAQDPVDWFVGSEGTLGVVVEAELALLPLPARVVGLGIPFAREEDALAFVVSAREAAGAGSIDPRCLEFLGAGAFAIAREAEGSGAWAAGADALVYAEEEMHGDEEPPLDEWLALAERHGALADDVRVHESEAELREARRLRHAVPATLNERGARHRAAGGRKVSTDWAVPFRRLAETLEASGRIADRHGVERAFVFGHAGNGHPHQNYIARDAAELERVERVVGETLAMVVAGGGTVAAEHGIGKLKKRWLTLQMSAVQIGVMRAVKRELDPLGLMAPGNVM
jgi:FAD/FMN-containing dehydrogenase